MNTNEGKKPAKERERESPQKEREKQVGAIVKY